MRRVVQRELGEKSRTVFQKKHAVEAAVPSNSHKEFPREARGLNWGAFWLRWIWGIRHKAWSTIITAIPIIGNLFAFYFLFKGNEIAWNKCKWKDVEHFKSTQRWWSHVAWLLVAACAVPTFLVIRSYYL